MPDLDDAALVLLDYAWSCAGDLVGRRCPGRQCQPCKHRCVLGEWLTETREGYLARLAELEAGE